MDTSIVKIISAELLFVYEFNSNKFYLGSKELQILAYPYEKNI